ncbi:hypothetical protein ES703_15473 [subsurface metagenome]
MFYKAFSVTGVGNKTTLDDGLVSTVDEPVTISAVLIDVSYYENNIIEGWIGTKRILEIMDKVLNCSYIHAAASSIYSTTRIVRIPIDYPILVGSIFKIGINCGAVPTDINGAYEYIKTP